MLKVFNTNSLGQNERFLKAVLFGIPLSLILSILFAIIQRLLRIRFSLLYLGLGYLIAYVLRKYGRGVQPKFAFLGLALTFSAMLLGDIFTLTGFMILSNPSIFVDAIIITLNSWISININNLLTLLFRVYSLYIAYTSSRII